MRETHSCQSKVWLLLLYKFPGGFLGKSLGCYTTSAETTHMVHECSYLGNHWTDFRLLALWSTLFRNEYEYFTALIWTYGDQSFSELNTFNEES